MTGRNLAREERILDRVSDSGEGAEPKSIADETYRRLRHDIITGALPTGMKLGMKMLRERYGVGLSPLREALVRLTGDALAVAESQRGFWVADLSSELLTDTMNTRLLIENQALALAIERGGPDWEQAVRAAYAELAELEARLAGGERSLAARAEQANRRFHEALVSGCGSPWLLRLWRMLYRHSERYLWISRAQADVDRNVSDEHEALFSAALARNALRASRLLDLHLERTTAAVQRALQARFAAATAAAPARPARRGAPQAVGGQG